MYPLVHLLIVDIVTCDVFLESQEKMMVQREYVESPVNTLARHCFLVFKCTKKPPHCLKLLQNLPNCTKILQNLPNSEKLFKNCRIERKH